MRWLLIALAFLVPFGAAYAQRFPIELLDAMVDKPNYANGFEFKVTKSAANEYAISWLDTKYLVLPNGDGNYRVQVIGAWRKWTDAEQVGVRNNGFVIVDHGRAWALTKGSDGNIFAVSFWKKGGVQRVGVVVRILVDAQDDGGRKASMKLVYDTPAAQQAALGTPIAAMEAWGNAPVTAAQNTVAQVTTPPPAATTGPAAPSTIAKPTVVEVASAPIAATGARIALVVGNSTYAGDFGRLANPINDSQAVSAALRRAGFDVILVSDADQKGIKRAIIAFGQRLNAAGKGATGLFYYAGHGVQSRGVNYLIPVGAAITTEADIEVEAVAADLVLRQMEEAGTSTSIVILDACRNLPVQRSLRDGTRGLARMDAPNGSFLAYSTAPGATAVDGSGSNSPFAQAFVAELEKPGQDIQRIFLNVRRSVFQATGGKQTPWDSSSLMDSFVFVPAK